MYAKINYMQEILSVSTVLQSEGLLVFRAGARLCAIPVSHVAEVLRPLPTFPAPDAPPYVAGATILRGSPTPVIDLGALVNNLALDDPRRMISLRVDGNRCVGLLVSEVIGVRADAERAQARAPLIENCPSEVIEELGQLDGRLLTVLRLGSIVPDETWAALEREQA